MMRAYFKYISAGLFFLLVLYGIIWGVRLVWFRPADPDLYLDRLFVEWGLLHPEQLSEMRPPWVHQIREYDNWLDMPYGDPGSVPPERLLSQAAEILSGYTLTDLTWQQQRDIRLARTWASRYAPAYPTVHRYAAGDYLFQIQRTLVLVHPMAQVDDAIAYVNRVRRVDEQLRDRQSQWQALGALVPLSGKQALQARLDSFRTAVPTQHSFYRGFAAKAVRANPVSLNQGRAQEWLSNISGSLERNIFPAVGEWAASLAADTADRQAYLPMADSQYRALLLYYGMEEVAPAVLHRQALKAVDSLQHLLGALQDSLREAGARASWQPFEGHQGDFYPATDSGGFQLLEDMRNWQSEIREVSAGIFDPEAAPPLRLRRFPEAWAGEYPLMTYIGPDFSGSRRGALYAQFDQLAGLPAWWWQLAVYRCGYPGTHLLTGAQRLNESLPALRKVMDFPAMEEGWGLYGLYLLDRELSWFSRSPDLELGYRQVLLMAAALLAADTGVHHRGWSPAEAALFLREKALFPEAWSRQAAEELFLYPGKAGAAWYGLTQWIALEMAFRQAEGEEFYLKEFIYYVINMGLCTPEIYREFRKEALE